MMSTFSWCPNVKENTDNSVITTSVNCFHNVFMYFLKLKNVGCVDGLMISEQHEFKQIMPVFSFLDELFL